MNIWIGGWWVSGCGCGCGCGWGGWLDRWCGSVPALLGAKVVALAIVVHAPEDRPGVVAGLVPHVVAAGRIGVRCTPEVWSDATQSTTTKSQIIMFGNHRGAGWGRLRNGHGRQDKDEGYAMMIPWIQARRAPPPGMRACATAHLLGHRGTEEGRGATRWGRIVCPCGCSTLYHGHPCPSFWLGPDAALGRL